MALQGTNSNQVSKTPSNTLSLDHVSRTLPFYTYVFFIVENALHLK